MSPVLCLSLCVYFTQQVFFITHCVFCPSGCSGAMPETPANSLLPLTILASASGTWSLHLTACHSTSPHSSAHRKEICEIPALVLANICFPWHPGKCIFKTLPTLAVWQQLYQYVKIERWCGLDTWHFVLLQSGKLHWAANAL